MTIDSNKFGGIVTYMRLGKQVIRTLPLVVNDPKTEIQTSQRDKYLANLNFCKAFITNLKYSWSELPINKTYWNECCGYNLKNSMVIVNDIWINDLTLVKIANGSLEPIQILSVQLNLTPGNMYFLITWANNSGTGNALATDKIDIIALNTENRNMSKLIGGFRRDGGPAYLHVPDSWQGYKIAIWIYCYKEDLTLASNSQMIYYGNP